jgi:hypothetical protein
MHALYPTKSQEKYAYLTYGSFVPVITGLDKEAIDLEGIKTIEELIAKLDKKYPGIRDIFLPPGGVFNSKTAITLKRAGKPPVPVIDQKQEVEAGDTIFLW